MLRPRPGHTSSWGHWRHLSCLSLCTNRLGPRVANRVAPASQPGTAHAAPPPPPSSSHTGPQHSTAPAPHLTPAPTCQQQDHHGIVSRLLRRLVHAGALELLLQPVPCHGQHEHRGQGQRQQCTQQRWWRQCGMLACAPAPFPYPAARHAGVWVCSNLRVGRWVMNSCDAPSSGQKGGCAGGLGGRGRGALDGGSPAAACRRPAVGLSGRPVPGSRTASSKHNRKGGGGQQATQLKAKHQKHGTVCCVRRVERACCPCRLLSAAAATRRSEQTN